MIAGNYCRVCGKGLVRGRSSCRDCKWALRFLRQAKPGDRRAPPESVDPSREDRLCRLAHWAGLGLPLFGRELCGPAPKAPPGPGRVRGQGRRP